MPGPWKEWKSKSSFTTLSTVPWKSRKKREISTFPQPGFVPVGKVENQTQVSHFSTRGFATTAICLLSESGKSNTNINTNINQRRSATDCYTSLVFRITLYWK